MVSEKRYQSRCDDCFYWSFMIAKCEGEKGYIEALCLRSKSKNSMKYMPEHHPTCEEFKLSEYGERADSPGT